jgi:hypothetical protein
MAKTEVPLSTLAAKSSISLFPTLLLVCYSITSQLFSSKLQAHYVACRATYRQVFLVRFEQGSYSWSNMRGGI